MLPAKNSPGAQPVNTDEFAVYIRAKAAEMKTLIESRDANKDHWKCFDTLEEWCTECAENIEKLDILTRNFEAMIEKLPLI